MKVYINDLKFKTIIGILDFERQTPQDVIIDINFDYNYKDKKFVDYSQVVMMVEQTMKKKRFKLIEQAIEFLQKKLNKKFPIENLVIKITKPNILKNCKVSVEG